MRSLALGLIAGIWAFAPAAAHAQTAVSDWIKGNSSRIRLIAGKLEPGARIVAGVQIDLDEGWKTYWRNPGDAGGVPPELDWAASGNLAKTELMFPAPMRLRDATGDNIGYKHGVILPVAILAADPTQPMRLDLKILFGVCSKICIPEDRHLTLTLDPGAQSDQELVDLLSAALAKVPGDPAKDARSPQVQSVRLDAAAILIDAKFPSGVNGADLFVESTDGSYVPMTSRLADSGDGLVHFSVDLSKTDDFKRPSGKSLKLTLVSLAGASESMRVLP